MPITRNALYSKFAHVWGSTTFSGIRWQASPGMKLACMKQEWREIVNRKKRQAMKSAFPRSGWPRMKTTWSVPLPDDEQGVCRAKVLKAMRSPILTKTFVHSYFRQGIAGSIPFWEKVSIYPWYTLVMFTCLARGSISSNTFRQKAQIFIVHQSPNEIRLFLLLLIIIYVDKNGSLL